MDFLNLGISIGAVNRREGAGVNVAAILADLQSELTAASIWAELDVLHIIAQGSLAASLINVKAPGTNNLLSFGDPTFVPYSHIAGDAVDAYLQSFQPDGSGNYKLNDAMVFLWTKGPSSPVVGNYALGTPASSTVFIQPRRTTGIGTQNRLNSGVTQSTYSPSGEGGLSLDRSSSGGYDIVYNGEKIGASVNASTSLPSGPLNLLRLITTYSSNELQAFAVGGSLGLSAQRTLYRAVSRCLWRLGAISENQHRWAPGAQTWYNSPRATVFGSDILTGGVHPEDGSIMAHILPGDGEPARAFMLDQRFEIDDHDNPAVFRESVTGKYWAMWSPHNGTETVMAISTNADDPTIWNARILLDAQYATANYSYHNPIQLADEANRIYNFFRAGANPDWTVNVSYTDAQDGTGWQTAVPLFWAGRPYLIPDSDGASRIDMLLTSSGVADLSTNSIYHCYYEGGDLFKSDGTLIGDMIADAPHAQADVTLVYDGSGVLGRAQNFDIVRYLDGRIALGYATYADIDNHLYRRALWSGGAWTSETICEAGGAIDDPLDAQYSQGYYSGGFVFDRDDPDIAYCSRETGGVHQIFRMDRDGSGTWAATQLTSGSEACFRPYHVKDTRKLTYVVGSYPGYRSFQTRLAALAI